jgi:hypothetical protein
MHTHSSSAACAYNDNKCSAGRTRHVSRIFVLDDQASLCPGRHAGLFMSSSLGEMVRTCRTNLNLGFLLPRTLGALVTDVRVRDWPL